MATYVLIHGSSGSSDYWYRVVPKLAAAGHRVIAVDLPGGDDAAGFGEYADAAVDAIGDVIDDVIGEAIGARSDVILVGQSMGAFTAPIVATRVPTALVVLLAPMIPAPGESPGDWWANVGQPRAQRDMAARDGFEPGVDLMTIFLHDVPAEVVDELFARGEPAQSFAIFGRPWPLDRWPDVPTRVLVCRRDRLFPLEMAHRCSRDRLGITADEIDAGHLAALSRPDEVVAALESYRTAAGL